MPQTAKLRYLDLYTSISTNLKYYYLANMFFIEILLQQASIGDILSTPVSCLKNNFMNMDPPTPKVIGSINLQLAGNDNED